NMLDKLNKGADDQPGKKIKIGNPNISVFGLQQIRAGIINILDHDLISCIRVVHGLFKIASIFLVRDVAIITKEERAVIRVVRGMFFAVKHLYFSDDGQECKKDGYEQEHIQTGDGQ